jgi:hypothetical protein
MVGAGTAVGASVGAAVGASIGAVVAGTSVGFGVAVGAAQAVASMATNTSAIIGFAYLNISYPPYFFMLDELSVPTYACYLFHHLLLIHGFQFDAWLFSIAAYG